MVVSRDKWLLWAALIFSCHWQASGDAQDLTQASRPPEGASQAEAVSEEEEMRRRLLEQSKRIEELSQALEMLASQNGAGWRSPARRLDDADVKTALDYMWAILCGSLVMIMQLGFALLEAGSVRAQSAGSLLLKNLLDACIGTLAWFLLGYGLSCGVSADPDRRNSFVGQAHFASAGFLALDGEEIVGTRHFPTWFFQWAFCTTTGTITSGAVAERMKLLPYLTHAACMTGFIYPIVVYWAWSEGGWASKKGFSDFAGSGVVHMTGGAAALAGAILVGPRAGRWDEGAGAQFMPHNMGFIVLGTFILWFGWYGFNCGSTLGMHDAPSPTLAGLVAMNTTLAAAVAGLTVFLLRLRTGVYDLGGTCNGLIAGLVASCAGAASSHPAAAIGLGLCGALAYECGSLVCCRLRIDDPMEAVAVHGFAGLAGCLLRPLVDVNGVQVEMFGWHVLTSIAICSWSAGWTALLLLPFRLADQLRLSDEDQHEGSDKHLKMGMNTADAAAARAQMMISRVEDQWQELSCSLQAIMNRIDKLSKEEGPPGPPGPPGPRGPRGPTGARRHSTDELGSEPLSPSRRSSADQSSPEPRSRVSSGQRSNGEARPRSSSRDRLGSEPVPEPVSPVPPRRRSESEAPVSQRLQSDSVSTKEISELRQRLSLLESLKVPTSEHLASNNSITGEETLELRAMQLSTQMSQLSQRMSCIERSIDHSRVRHL